MAGVTVEFLKILNCPVHPDSVSISTVPVADVILSKNSKNYLGKVVFKKATVEIKGSPTPPSGTSFQLGDNKYDVTRISRKGSIKVGGKELEHWEVIGIDLQNPQVEP